MKTRNFIARLNILKDKSDMVFGQLMDMELKECEALILRVDEQLLDQEIQEFKNAVKGRAGDETNAQA